MSKNTRFTPPFRFKIAARLAIVLLCVSSSLVFSDISWGKKPTREEIRNLIEKLDTNDEIERDKTIGELREIGKDAVPFLVKAALENESLLVRIGVKEVFQNQFDESAADELVCIIGQGAKYHRPSPSCGMVCAPVNRHRVRTMLRGAAINAGYTACKQCRPR